MIAPATLDPPTPPAARCTDTWAAAPSPVDLLEGVRSGDERAWELLTARYVRLLWSVTNRCRLGEEDAQDVIQTTWIRLLQNVDRIREPVYLAQWLVVTVRRECWRLSARQREAPDTLGDELAHLLPSVDEPVDAALLRREDAGRLWDAVAQLPTVQQRVIRALAAEDEPTYDEVADALGIPRGSLGPTRLRALKRLRIMLADGGPVRPTPGAGGSGCPRPVTTRSRPSSPAVNRRDGTAA